MALPSRSFPRLIRTHDIRKVFLDRQKGEVRAVDGVSFEVAEGKVVGLLGGNGAGKTTLLRMLATLIQPSSGSAEVGGLDTVRQSNEVRRKLGFLSSSTALYGRLTGREVLEYFGGLYGMGPSQTKSRIEEMSETLRLGEFLNRQCDKMSTGQKQRISIARTVLHQPPILFLDEPTAGLDVMTSQTVMEFIEDYRQRGATILYSTHIMSEAERLCREVLMIHGGRLAWSGTLDNALHETGESRLEPAFLKLIGYEKEIVS